jgi:hypothetical protein
MIFKRTLGALLCCVLFLASFPGTAAAIAQKTILARAASWEKEGVMYSQSAHHDGYRRDCSGFVSMAWKLRTSYTTHNFGSIAKHISLRSMIPGDAVWEPGHLMLFVRWTKPGRTFLAVEEYNWGHPAKYRQHSVSGSMRAYRHPQLVTAQQLEQQVQLKLEEDARTRDMEQAKEELQAQLLKEKLDVFGPTAEEPISIDSSKMTVGASSTPREVIVFSPWSQP